MTAPHSKAPELGNDDIVRFVDIGQFLEEVAGNLGRGRALVRSRRRLGLNARLMIGIEAPGTGMRMSADAVVVYANNDLIGLEIVGFRGQVENQLAALRDAAAASLLEPDALTVVSRTPLYEQKEPSPAAVHGSTQIYFGEEDERETGPISRSAIPEPLLSRDSTVLSGPPASFEWEPELPPPAHLRDDPPTEERAAPADEDLLDELTPPPRSLSDLDGLSRNPAFELFREPPPRLDEDGEAESAPASEPPLLETDPHFEFLQPEQSAPSEEHAPIVADLHASGPTSPSGSYDLPPKFEASLPMAGTLDTPHPALLRATPDGAVTIPDRTALLGLYLTQLRYGRVTILDGPAGPPGQPVVLRLTGLQDLELSAQVATRIGPWCTLDIDDPDRVRNALAADAPAWREALAEIFEPIAVPDQAPANAYEDHAPHPNYEAPPEPTPSRTPPQLEGHRVLFETTDDLRQEIDANLASGGLFVLSDALPMGERRQLEVVVDKTPWGVRLEADVVFAKDGRVGFSVRNAGEVRTRLQEIMTSGAPSRNDNSADLSVDLSPGSFERTGDLETFRGSLSPPLNDRALLGLVRNAGSDLSQGALPAAQIVQIIVRERWRGILTIGAHATRVQAWFHRGDVAFVTSEPFDEAKSLGRILINHKKLNELSLREGLEKSTSTRRPLGRTLVALGSIRKRDLVAALREQTRMKLETALEFKSGQFEWTPWIDPPGDADLVLTRGLSVLGRYVRNRLESLKAHEVETLFASDFDRIVVPLPGMDPTNSGLNLQPKELRFLELQLDGKRNIQDATLGSPVGRLASLRLVGLCLSVGLLRFADGGDLRQKSPRRRSAPATSLERGIRERIALMEGQNHFDVLGVHWSAHPRNYQEAWERARQEFALNQEPLKDAPDSIRALARSVLGKIEESFRAIKDRDQRVRYRKELFDRTEREYAADMLVKQGEVALMRGDRVSAIECLETAVELNPSNRNRALLVSAREGRS